MFVRNVISSLEFFSIFKDKSKNYTIVNYSAKWCWYNFVITMIKIIFEK
jgi:hypothetical protein